MSTTSSDSFPSTISPRSRAPSTSVPVAFEPPFAAMRVRQRTPKMNEADTKIPSTVETLQSDMQNLELDAGKAKKEDGILIAVSDSSTSSFYVHASQLGTSRPVDPAIIQNVLGHRVRETFGAASDSTTKMNTAEPSNASTTTPRGRAAINHAKKTQILNSRRYRADVAQAATDRLNDSTGPGLQYKSSKHVMAKFLAIEPPQSQSFVHPGAAPRIQPTVSYENTSKNTHPDREITLNICGRDFKAPASLLAPCGYLTAFLNRPAFPLTANTHYIYSADPDAFKHVLRYLRTKSFPLFWTQQTGFDFALYARVFNSATFFQVEPLIKWISDQKYLTAITTEITLKTYSTDGGPLSSTTAGNAEKIITPHPAIHRVYFCPRGVQMHRGRPDRCDYTCRMARGNDELLYEEEVSVKVVTVTTKKTVFKPEVLKG